MNPLESIVGLSPADAGPDRMYVNRLPNVSHHVVEAIAEAEERSVQDPTGLKTIWQEVKDEAYDQLKSYLLSEFAKRANFREVLEQSEIPDEISGGETESYPAGTMVGVTITMPKSRYQQLFIRSLFISFTGEAPDNAIICIYDGNRGTQIGEDIVVAANPDSFEYPVNIAIDCSKSGNRSIFIGALMPAGVSVREIGWQRECMYSVTDLHVFDLEAMPFMGTMIETGECYAALDYEIRLSMDKVVELFKDKLRRSYALLCGISIIDRALKSKKANRHTLVNREAEYQNIADLKEDLKKEMAGACRQVYGQLEMEKLALVSRPDDQQGYFVGSFV